MTTRITIRMASALIAACLTAGPATAEEPVPPPRGPAEALAWYAKAAQAGKADAQFLYAMMLEQGMPGAADGPDPVAALPWYKRAAEQGHVQAQYRLASLLYTGRGAKPNPIGAARWYAAAAEHGHARAQYDYALMLERGHGIAADPNEAAKWYEKAALAGIAQAALNLGVMRARDFGEDLPRAPLEALTWMEVATSLGMSGLGPHRGALAESLTPDERRIVHERSRAHLRAIRGLPPAPQSPPQTPPTPRSAQRP